MAGYLDDFAIGVPCPGCGHETEKKIGWLKAHDQITCGGCGETIDITDAGFRNNLAKAEKAIRDTFKGFK